ncbi:MAG: TlyA family RNA methyltransferase [Chloroflexota bacterium]|nr:TlyA family RNA methyltransferase [Chloroflexota bacterium]
MARPPRPKSTSSSPSARAGRARLDVALVERGLIDSREKAQAVILAGQVTVDGQLARKPSESVTSAAEVVVAPSGSDEFASRGGHKLAHALDRFAISIDGRVCLDAGASTGGFTDVLLRRGAARVYAVDVGWGQLDWRLRNDPRVVVRERTNIRHLDALPEPIELAVIDVSFISLRLALPPIGRLLRPGAPIVALVKPQFEAGKGQVGRGGVVRDRRLHRRIVVELWAWAGAHGFAPCGLTASPIRGPAGNVEFLLWLENARNTSAPDIGAVGTHAGSDDERAVAGAPASVDAVVDAALAEAPTA